MNISCIVVDDDKMNIHTLEYLIESECEHLSVVGNAQNITDARKLIDSQKPDVVFLDVEMPGGTGFELLASLPVIPFKVVFTTAHEHYALKALKANAVDFLLKPIDEEELIATEQKLVHVFNSEEQSESYQNNIQRFSQKKLFSEPSHKIVLSDTTGYKIVDTRQIECIIADNNYSTIYFDDKSTYLSAKSLRDLEEVLSEELFIRVHKSHIINIEKLKEIKTGDNSKAILQSGKSVSISRRRVKDLVQRIGA